MKSAEETSEIAKSPEIAALSATVISGRSAADVKMPHSRLIELHTQCESNCTLRISQYYYPAWQAKIMPTGAEVPLRSASPGGMMEISLPPGESSVRIELPRSWSEFVGLWVSLGGLDSDFRIGSH